MKTGKSIMSILGGVAVGTALGVLFAPDKGTNTRKKIAEKSNDLKNKAKDTLIEVADTVTEKYNTVIDKSQELAKEVKENINGNTKVEGDIKTVREQMNK